MKRATSSLTVSEKLMLTVDEFCEMIGFGRTTFYKAVNAGDLKVQKYRKRTFVAQEEARRFVKNMPKKG
jgi:predicted DNA-binding transcriptional regulator AlpA